MKNEINAIRLNESDNIAIALKNIRKGDSIVVNDFDKQITVKKGVPYGHKVSLREIDKGEKILKYGECMGIAKLKIEEGYHVHTENVRGLNEKEHERILNNQL